MDESKERKKYFKKQAQKKTLKRLKTNSPVWTNWWKEKPVPEDEKIIKHNPINDLKEDK